MYLLYIFAQQAFWFQPYELRGQRAIRSCAHPLAHSHSSPSRPGGISLDIWKWENWNRFFLHIFLDFISISISIFLHCLRFCFGQYCQRCLAAYVWIEYMDDARPGVTDILHILHQFRCILSRIFCMAFFVCRLLFASSEECSGIKWRSDKMFRAQQWDYEIQIINSFVFMSLIWMSS